jgi:hypothetical protein
MFAKILNIRPTLIHKDFRQALMNPFNILTSLSVTSAATRIEFTIPEDGSNKFLETSENFFLYIIRTH